MGLGRYLKIFKVGRLCRTWLDMGEGLWISGSLHPLCLGNVEALKLMGPGKCGDLLCTNTVEQFT